MSIIWKVQPKDHTFHSAAATNATGDILYLNGDYTELIIGIVGASAWDGTITFNASQDGTNYDGIAGVNVETLAIATTATGVTAQILRFNVAGVKMFKCPITSRTAGTVTATGAAIVGPGIASNDIIDRAARALGKVTVDASGIADLVTLLARIGEVQASPTANTVLDRLKTLDTTMSGTLTIQITDSITGTSVSDSQTRPDNTTAYTALDVVGEDPATNLEFANVISTAAGAFVILGASLEIDVAAIPAGMTSFRLHLYNAAPTAIADNAAYNLPSGDRAKYLGYLTIATFLDLGDTVFGQENNINFAGKLAAASTSLYGILQTVAGFTPTAQTVKKVTLNVAAL